MSEHLRERTDGSGGAGGRWGNGWVPDPHDHRDFVFPESAKALADAAKTPHVDLSTAKEMPEVWDQQELNSCTAHAAGAAWEFAARRSGRPVGMPSRLFIWYEGRRRDGIDVHADAAPGSAITIRTAFNVMRHGVPPEQLWPYDVAKVNHRPPKRAYEVAGRQKLQRYFIVKQELPMLKAALASGHSICFGFQFFPSIKSPEVEHTGVVPMPTADDLAGPIGLHAALLVGYDEPTKRFKVRNSLGPSWGQEGYFTLPYEYVCSQWATVFWAVLFES